MWCRSDARLWHAVIYFISPLCGVAQTPDCGMLLFIYFISPLCGVAQTPDCGMLLFIYFISPLCGVAQTPDCSNAIIYLPYKPFMWCRSDARLWHA